MSRAIGGMTTTTTITTTITSRDLNQDLARAKRAARNNPVVVTDRGAPAHVIMSYEHYQALLSEAAGHRENLCDALSTPGLSDIAFDPPKADLAARPIDLA